MKKPPSSDSYRTALHTGVMAIALVAIATMLAICIDWTHLAFKMVIVKGYP